MDHKRVRVFLDRTAAEAAPPDVVRENKVVSWADALYANCMRIAAAGVLESEGSLDKAASVLWWAGFEVPANYFPGGHEGEYLDLRDEPALRLWVEGEAERIKDVTETIGFYLAGSGRLLDKADKYIQ